MSDYAAMLRREARYVEERDGGGFQWLDEAAAEIEQLRAENDKLRMGDVVIRRTRDGVPVYPDSLVFLLFPLLPRPSKVARRFAREVPDRLWSRVYSTELAALAAAAMSDTSTIITELDRWFRSDQGISSRKKELLRNTIMAIEQLQALARVDRSDWRHIDIGDTGFFCDPRIAAEIERLRAENARLRAAVECLPKTADGVPITASSVVYSKGGEPTRLSWQVMHCAHLYYSSLEAAAKALAAGGGDEET